MSQIDSFGWLFCMKLLPYLQVSLVFSCSYSKPDAFRENSQTRVQIELRGTPYNTKRILSLGCALWFLPFCLSFPKGFKNIGSKSIRTVDSLWTKKKHMQIKHPDFLIFPPWVTQKQLHYPNSSKYMGDSKSIDNPLFHVLLFNPAE